MRSGKLVEDELQRWAEERRLGRQMGAAAERDWIKREGHKLFKKIKK